MAAEKISFEDFIITVNQENQPFVVDLHNELVNYGCKQEIKSAKSGYVLSYIINKKTIANYVFRKSGLIIRIYANHILDYMSFMDTLPSDMCKEIKKAPDCKRIINPNDCNPKCSMGYDFVINSERYQKCRYNAFMFLICDESKEYIKAFVLNEAKACSSKM